MSRLARPRARSGPAHGRPPPGRVAFLATSLYAPAMIRIVAKADPDFEARVRALCERAATIPEHIEAAARDVIRAVRAGGDAAVRELTFRFEKRQLGSLELPRAEWQEAAARVDGRTRQAIDSAARRIRAFHERERYPSFEIR